MDLCIFRFLSWSQTRPSPKLLLLILFLVLSLDTRKKWAPHPLWDMTVLPSPLHFLFIPELFKNSLFIHLGLLPLLLDFLHISMDHSWGWKRWSLKFNHLSYITLLSVGLYPTKFFQSGLWNSETQNSVWILLCSIISPARSVPSIHTFDWFFLFCIAMTSGEAPPYISSSSTCVINLSSSNPESPWIACVLLGCPSSSPLILTSAGSSSIPSKIAMRSHCSLTHRATPLLAVPVCPS